MNGTYEQKKKMKKIKRREKENEPTKTNVPIAQMLNNFINQLILSPLNTLNII